MHPGTHIRTDRQTIKKHNAFSPIYRMDRDINKMPQFIFLLYTKNYNAKNNATLT